MAKKTKQVAADTETSASMPTSQPASPTAAVTTATKEPSTSDTTGVTSAESPTSAPSPIVDKRSGRGKADFADSETYKRNPNRLSNVRWPIGEEPYPDTPGTEKDDGWVNVKIERVNPPLEPNQKHLLSDGAKVKIKCHVCGQQMHVAAARSARKVLQDGGYVFKEGKSYKGLEKRLVIIACPAGHTQQWHEDFIERVKVKD